MKHLAGRTAVITGAASGFGLEASRMAARSGMNVVMADVQPDALEPAAEEIRALGAQVLPFQMPCSFSRSATSPPRVRAWRSAASISMPRAKISSA